MARSSTAPTNAASRREFPVGGVIKGWTEALQLMPVGSKWQLFIPPDLAYGKRGAGGAIGPDQTLVFDVELISIQGQVTEAAARRSRGRSAECASISFRIFSFPISAPGDRP